MTYSAAQIRDAVNDEEWQRFRLSMKGKRTIDKLDMLVAYYDDQAAGLDNAQFRGVATVEQADATLEVVKIRIDNYIKALCRGGQLEAGMTFDHFNDGCIRNHIKK